MHRHSRSPAATMSYLVIDTSSKTMSPFELDTWSIAKVAHDKLVMEAGFLDHDLRKIVAHATLYDRLLDEYYSTSPPSSPPSPPSPTKLAFEDIVHHGIVVVEHAELSLVKVASHSDNMHMNAAYAKGSWEAISMIPV
ncbi:uncharacterized protein LY89DRAFT_476744 [Mollisia scopiformis]|uniref:Uncharacterized protein n=1 Tax=Mollisia scopiformis TaxID=149040 RepID=A0A194XG40_MOLSC|nr:uncharacterized protein LY89DRAFT_476744 [Mollisia scopiformis]KUJ19094.1 hypothetical protein LY89DRAFT_476744 [Mollisia scopiformis]